MTRAILWAAVLLAVAFCLLQPATPDALPVGLVSLGLFMWGCARLAHERGHPYLFGAVLGVLNVLGMFILATLPPGDRLARRAGGRGRP